MSLLGLLYTKVHTIKTTTSNSVLAHSSVSKVSRLQDLMTATLIPNRDRYFPLNCCFHTDSKAYPITYSMNTSPYFPSGRANHLPPSSAKVTKLWDHTSVPPHVLWYLVKYMDNLILHFTPQ